MLLSDYLYGQLNITEPVILELLSSPYLKRLAGIDNGGYTKPYWPGKTIINRLDHSIGVYWLLKTYGAPLAEQVAGLIHDVSHSAFSHCIDYILEGDGGKQDHQDNIFAGFVKDSNIPAILAKHGLDIDYILDDDNFPLKEKSLPNLCADRLDYSLRTAIVYEGMSGEEARGILSHLKATDGNWIFTDMESARRYAELFRKMNADYYSGLLGAVQHYAASRYFRYALDKGYINRADLYTTDNEVLGKVRSFHGKDAALLALSARLENRVPYREVKTGGEAVVALKSRAVDPLFFAGKEIKRLSQAMPEWSRIVEEELKPKIRRLEFEA